MSEIIETRNRQGQYARLIINLGEESLQYVAKSQNEKTGTLPAQFIGASREESEKTCTICPLWKAEVCYAQDGSVQLGHAALLKKQRSGADRGIDQALEDAHEDAQYVRMGAIGDPGSIAPEVYQEHERKAREWGFGVLSYTHSWYLPHAKHLKGRALASADTKKDVEDAVASGWRVAVHIDDNDTKMFGVTMAEKPQGTVKMHGTEVKYFLCPAQREQSNVTCNTCGLCDGTKKISPNVIVFLEHGLQMGFKKARDAKKKEATV